jgi:hypothetical protein
MREVLDEMPTDREALRVALTRADAQAERRQVKPSRRAQRTWDRLGDWYGARFADQYGDLPPQDWCSVIDRTTNDELVGAMMLVRQRHVTFPPTLPEFASLVKEVRQPRRAAPSLIEQLADFVVLHCRLTPAQLSGRWTFLYRESDVAPITTGVVIPADGDTPGHRVMVEDMQAASVDL